MNIRTRTLSDERLEVLKVYSYILHHVDSYVYTVACLFSHNRACYVFCQLPSFRVVLTANVLIVQESAADTLSDHASINADLATSASGTGHSATSPDATIRIIKDQLIRAKTYLGVLASRGNHGTAKELRARMKDIQRALGDATDDGMLPQKYFLFHCTTEFPLSLLVSCTLYCGNYL